MENFKTFPATIFRYKEATPIISGFPDDPNNYKLIETRLDPNKKESKNNHHGCHAAKKFGQFVIFQLCRDFEFSQFPMFIDQHDWWHNNHEETPLPTWQQAMDRIEAAKECDERIRIGSLHKPKFRLLNEGDIFKVNREFNQEAQIKIVSYSQL